MAKSEDRIALEGLQDALNAVMKAAGGNPPQVVIKRIRNGLAAHAAAIESARAATDPIHLPSATFDPFDPKIVGRVVSLALIAQPRVSLRDIQSAYGSGVYAIYYDGDHPFYAGISGTETPIYVGKADPAKYDASTAREQGSKLSARLLEHAGTIGTAEIYASKAGLSAGLHSIRLSDFSCRRLVCATNAQLVAEQNLIRMFWPIWNSETKACWGMSKHGDAAKTRANKRSPWDVIHPGRAWALDKRLADSLSPEVIHERILAILKKAPPRRNRDVLFNEILGMFRQDSVSRGNEDEETPLGIDVAGPEAGEAGVEAD